jgi:hypothetical protein
MAANPSQDKATWQAADSPRPCRGRYLRLNEFLRKHVLAAIPYSLRIAIDPGRPAAHWQTKAYGLRFDISQKVG